MAKINQKYLKDEDGNIISPITSSDSVYLPNKKSLTQYVEDTGWHYATLTSDFVDYESQDRLRYRRVGKVVLITGTVTPKSSIHIGYPMVNICTLPVGYRPSSSIRQICQGSGYNRWLLQISSSGIVQMDRYGTAETDIPNNTWLPLSCTYMVD